MTGPGTGTSQVPVPVPVPVYVGPSPIIMGLLSSRRNGLHASGDKATSVAATRESANLEAEGMKLDYKFNKMQTEERRIATSVVRREAQAQQHGISKLPGREQEQLKQDRQVANQASHALFAMQIALQRLEQLVVEEAPMSEQREAKREYIDNVDILREVRAVAARANAATADQSDAARPEAWTANEAEAEGRTTKAADLEHRLNVLSVVRFTRAMHHSASSKHTHDRNVSIYSSLTFLGALRGRARSTKRLAARASKAGPSRTRSSSERRQSERSEKQRQGKKELGKAARTGSTKHFRPWASGRLDLRRESGESGVADSDSTKDASAAALSTGRPSTKRTFGQWASGRLLGTGKGSSSKVQPMELPPAAARYSPSVGASEDEVVPFSVGQ